MKVGIAQINTTIGALEENSALIVKSVEEAKKQGVDLLVFPELTITGYPPQDLLFNTSFIDKNLEQLQKLVKCADGIAVLIGFVDRQKEKLYNAAAFIKDKKIVGIHHKQFLPNYDVFDEHRYFEPGKTLSIFSLGRTSFGVTICEDIWVNKTPSSQLVRKGAKMIVNMSASPYTYTKRKKRQELLSSLAKTNKVPFVYCNLVGANDHLLFDGHSCVYDKKGDVLSRAKGFEEELLVTDLLTSKKPEVSSTIEDIHSALVMGIRDYVRKHGFEKVTIGVSGGIDSAVTLTLAIDALGKENVTAALMPGKYTTWKSLFDARKLCKDLNVEYHTFFIRGIVGKFEGGLKSLFKKTKKGIAEQNLQARTRGTLLMALSNKFGWLVLGTGNKSEVAVGYCTLYGDAVGSVSVLGDVYKGDVYRLAKYHNATSSQKIPLNILQKEPSAELAENQKDSDDLPPYDVLDKILHAYVDEGCSFDSIVSLGFEKAIVEKVLGMVDRNEFKRQQMPFCLKISDKSFGSGRRMPVTNKFKG